MLLGFKRACGSGLEARNMLGLSLCVCVIAGAVLVVVAVAVAVAVAAVVVAEAYGILLRHFWVSWIPRKAGKIASLQTVGFIFMLVSMTCGKLSYD